MSLSEQLAAGGDPGVTLSITFEDGYRDNVEVAAPILSRLGLPATFFVTTGLIGSQVIAPWDQLLPRQPGWMTWDQVRTLAVMGFEVGSHTDTHLDLARAEPAVARDDLAVSRQKLAEALGAASRLFAYPFGGSQHITPAARELVRAAGFACCASCYGDVNPMAPDAFDLRCIGIAEWFNNPNCFGSSWPLVGPEPRTLS